MTGPTTGLRAKQKARRNRSLLKAASTLFGQVGYEAARIDSIAEAAEVSVGTFYNYYENKAELLLAIVTMEVEEVLHQGAAVVAAPPEAVELALRRLISTYYDHSLVYLTKEMWRTAMAMAIQHPETPFSRRYHDLDAQLAAQVTALLQALQARGSIRAEADAGSLGLILFNDLNAAFTQFAMQEEMTLAALKDSLFARLHAVTGLIALRP